ncbi:hypothetical protein F4779DRAFT_622017 [Xylariaceae sp. FL0662B]|nr:hypothetical protein F4779DRAFT_622017 [Xylariaceae sp. FL0662B]
MSPISNEPDRGASEKFTAAPNHDAPDHDARLFCHLTMRGSDGAVISNIQIYTRKWLPVLNEDKSAHNTLKPLGMLERLPQEIRYMIYDLVFHPRFNYFDFTKHQVHWPEEIPLRADFSVPAVAHVCREMRRYAMCRYQLVWWSGKRVASNINRGERPGSRHERKTKEETTRSGFGVFQPDKDVIEIHLRTTFSEVELGEHVTVDWNDPTQAPMLKGLSARQVSYPPPRRGYCPSLGDFTVQDTFLTLIPKQSGMWEKTWKKDSLNKFQATLMKI